MLKIRRKGRLSAAGLMAVAVLVVNARAQAPQQTRFGIGVPTQNMINGQGTTDLDSFIGYRPGDQPWNPLGIGWFFNWNWVPGRVSDPAFTPRWPRSRPASPPTLTVTPMGARG
jgi:hypothetical protein